MKFPFNSILPIFTALNLSILASFLAIGTLFCEPTVAAENEKEVLKNLKGLDETALSEGKIALFDGATLYGLATPDKEAWSVQDGLLVGKGTPDSPAQIRPDIQFGEYKLLLKYKSKGEAVVYLQSRPNPKQSEIGKACTGVKLPESSDEFTTFEVSISGTELLTAAGDKATKMEVKSHGRGFIVLETSGSIEVEQWLLTPMNTQSLFDGKSLAGWKSRDDLTGEFSVEDGNLKVRGGRGQLEYEKPFGDFVLQMKAKVAKDDMNSGLFFRCIPGDVMMGYESQICHAHAEGDPTDPKDCGTGGIFRRQNARVVLPSEDEWFYKTIVAEGPNFAIWVNGVLVTRWTDTRKPHENPRSGYRKEAGTFMLQAHDPTTDMTLEKIEAAEMPARK